MDGGYSDHNSIAIGDSNDILQKRAGFTTGFCDIFEKARQRKRRKIFVRWFTSDISGTYHLMQAKAMYDFPVHV
jgi:fatty acid-binding protein DegV